MNQESEARPYLQGIIASCHLGKVFFMIWSQWHWGKQDHKSQNINHAKSQRHYCAMLPRQSLLHDLVSKAMGCARLQNHKTEVMQHLCGERARPLRSPSCHRETSPHFSRGIVPCIHDIIALFRACATPLHVHRFRPYRPSVGNKVFSGNGRRKDLLRQKVSLHSTTN